MRRFKQLAFSLLFLVLVGFSAFIVQAVSTDQKPYQELMDRYGYGQSASGKCDITQIKEEVNRSYWVFNQETPLHLLLAYPYSQIIHQESGLIEEIRALRAEASDASFHSYLVAETGLLDYKNNKLKVHKALLHYSKKEQSCDATVDEIVLDLKQHTPTFTAERIKAEIGP